MALLPYLSRYAQLYGRTPPVSPGVLSPPASDDDAAFNPGALESSVQGPNPLSPAPLAATSLSADQDPNQQQIDDQEVKPPGPKAGYKGLRLLRKEEEKRMPAPGTSNADVGASNVALPSLSEAPPPDSQSLVPGAVGITSADIAASANPALATPEPSQAIPTSAFPGAPTGKSQAIPSGAFPGGTQAGGSAAGVKSATQALEDLKRPDAAPNNWAQRLALAALSLTKFAPMANQIIHPKWSDENAKYQSQQADLEKRQKEEETAASTEAQVAQKNAQAANYQLTQDTRNAAAKERLQAAEDRIKQQTSETNRKFLADRLKGRESDSVYQQQTDQMPPGYEFIPDPSKPGFGFAAPPAWRPAPTEITPFLPGVKVGDMISHSDYLNGVKALQAQQLEGAKAANRNDPAGAQRTAFQQTLSKIAASNGGALPPGALTDPRVLSKLIHDAAPNVVPDDEKAQAQAFLATNNTPASTNAAGVNRMQIAISGRENQVLDTDTNQLMMLPPEVINAAPPGKYAPASSGTNALSKESIFTDLGYNIGKARKAIAGLGSLDVGTRAELAAALQEADPHSALSTFMHGAVASTMNDQQLEAVRAIQLLTENAMSLRNLGGMGQGSDAVRRAIIDTLPSGRSANVKDMQARIDQLEQVVNRLHTGVPVLGENRGDRVIPGGSKINVTAPDGSVYPFDTQAQADAFKKLIQGTQGPGRGGRQQ